MKSKEDRDVDENQLDGGKTAWLQVVGAFLFMFNTWYGILHGSDAPVQFQQTNPRG